MELSIIADWLGVVAGSALGISWARKFYRWLREKVRTAVQFAELGSSIVAELLESATSPARRADIHAYLHCRLVEIEGRHTRGLISQLAMAVAALFTGWVMVVLYRLLDTSQLPWLWWFFIANYAIAWIAFAMMLFFSWQLRHMELGWQKTAFQVLQDRAFSHVSSIKK